MAILACAQGNVEQEARNVGKNLASLGKLLALLGIFMKLIGGPEIPDLAHLHGAPLKSVIAPIDKLVQVLLAIRKAVPFPTKLLHTSHVL
jgi:hypothetical protein